MAKNVTGYSSKTKVTITPLILTYQEIDERQTRFPSTTNTKTTLLIEILIKKNQPVVSEENDFEQPFQH